MMRFSKGDLVTWTDSALEQGVHERFDQQPPYTVASYKEKQSADEWMKRGVLEASMLPPQVFIEIDGEERQFAASHFKHVA